MRNSLGVGLAVGTYGFAFGAASVAAGLSVLQTCLLSLLAFTGGTQFAVVGVIAGGGRVAAALGSGLLLGCAQHAVCDALGAAAAGARVTPARGRARHDRRVDGDGDRPTE